jgi:hypothetical protein
LGRDAREVRAAATKRSEPPEEQAAGERNLLRTPPKLATRVVYEIARSERGEPMTEPGARKPTKPAEGDRGDVRREKTSPSAPRGHAPKRAVRDPGLPARQGLYDPKNEKDSCGVGFIADMKNVKSHAIVGSRS